MNHYDKLIFVSRSDTATSPMAEAILQKQFYLEDILISSKGLVVLFPEPINPKAEAILASHSLSMKSHMSEQLEEEDFDPRTLILTMDREQKDKLLREHELAQGVLHLFIDGPGIAVVDGDQARPSFRINCINLISTVMI